MMQRRAFAAGMAAVMVAPAVSQAQQAAKVYRVAVVAAGTPLSDMRGADPVHPYVRSFIHELRALGYIESQNLILERRSAEGRFERFPDIFQELVRLNTDVIVTTTNGMAREAQKVTKSIPIVMAASLNPVEEGIVKSLARPGENTTGLTLDAGSGIVSKHLELLKELLPGVSRVALLQDRGDAHQPSVDEAQEAARKQGVALLIAEHSSEYGDAFDLIRRERPGALIVGYSARNLANRKLIVDFAGKLRLPLVAPYRDFAEVGGLSAYGATLSPIFRRAARYVDRILKGANPAEMPVELPQNFELIVNLKAARALGLTIPQSLLVRADEVIQ